MRFAHAHAIACAVHTASVVTLVLLAGGYKSPLFLHYSTWVPTGNATDCSSSICTIEPTSRAMGSVNILTACVLFGLWSAGCHAVAAFRLGGWRDPEGSLRAIRAVDYGVSAPVMIVLLYAVSGGTDCGAAVLAGALMCAVVLIDYFSRDALGLTAAAGLYTVVWFVIFSVFTPSGTAPDFVVIIVVAIAVLFTLFAVVRLAAGSFVAEETGFITLSMVAKTTLHWSLFSTILSRPGCGEERVPMGARSEVIVAIAVSVGVGLVLGGTMYYNLRSKLKVD
jgi:hypothetical protein